MYYLRAKHDDGTMTLLGMCNDRDFTFGHVAHVLSSPYNPPRDWRYVVTAGARTIWEELRQPVTLIRAADFARDLQRLVDMLMSGESIEHTTFHALEGGVWSPPQPFNDARGIGFAVEDVETQQRFEIIVREVA